MLPWLQLELRVNAADHQCAKEARFRTLILVLAALALIMALIKVRLGRRIVGSKSCFRILPFSHEIPVRIQLATGTVSRRSAMVGGIVAEFRIRDTREFGHVGEWLCFA